MAKRQLLKKIACIVLSVFICAFSVITCQAETIGIISSHPHVLFLSSYSYEWESIPKQLSGISNVLDGSAMIDYVFMDTKRLDYEDIKEDIYKDVLEREHVNDYDYVIAGDDAALQFVQEYRNDLFRDIPVIFEGINDVDNARKAAEDPLTTGIVEVFPLRETIQIAAVLNPKAVRVIGITDHTISGIGSQKQFYECQSDFPNLDFSVIDCSKLTLSEIKTKLASYGSDTILIFLNMNTDADGNSYTMTEAAETVASIAKTPVYKADELGIGNGILGGVVVSYHDMAADAAEIVLSLVHGTDISNYPIKTVSSICEFDENVMKQYGIKKSAVKSAYSGNIVFVNEKLTFLESHVEAIVPLTVIILLLLCFAIYAITNLRSKKRILKKMNDKDIMLNSILGNIPGGICEYRVKNSKPTVFTNLYFSSGVSKLSGYSVEEYKQLLSKRSFELTVSEEDLPGLYQILSEYVPQKKPFSTVFHLKCKDGSKRFITMSAVCGKDEKDGSSIYYGIYMDNSEQERVQQAEREAMEAKASNNAKSQFLSRMSHDIRTPLNAVLGFTALARDEKNNPAGTAEYLGKIDASGRYLLELINDVLDMSKIESGHMELCESSVDERISLQLTSDIFKAQADAKGIRLVTDFKLTGNPWVIEDPIRVDQIYSNLLSNAIKFSEPGTEIRWTVKEELRENGKIHSTSVIRDQGCGMSEDFINRIFIPFEQSNQAASNGTGLGLSIVKSLVNMMGGTIRVESTAGEGSIFTVELDLVQGSENKESEDVDINHMLEGLHILMCEDNQINGEIAQRLLEKKGCAVDCTENGKDGLQKFRESSEKYYDVILMDIRMPVMDGLTASRAIRALDRRDAASIPIIAMSANSFDEDIAACIDAGMNAHVSKPIEPLILYHVIASHLTSAD